MTTRALRLSWWLRYFRCYFHGGGDVKRDPAGNINWQCRKCGRWSDPVPMDEEDAASNVGQPDFSGKHVTGGRWSYNHNFMDAHWRCWQAAAEYRRADVPWLPEEFVNRLREKHRRYGDTELGMEILAALEPKDAV